MVLLTLTTSSALGQENEVERPVSRGAYLQFYGGAGALGKTNISQQGVAFFPEAAGGPLSVNATGASGTTAVGLGGLGIGYEWPGRLLGSEGKGWGLLPAAEFEVFYLGLTPKATLTNPTPRVPEHTFADTFPMDSAVFLANAVLSIRNPLERFTPYIGFGIGTSYLSIHGANSPQISPAEMGVNHFNSIPNASAWGFTTQFKAGFRIDLSDRCWIFTEYRLLTIHSANFTFGSTQYPTHAPTTPWSVGFGRMTQNVGVVGVGLSF